MQSPNRRATPTYFQGAIGHHFTLAAQALESGISREAVRIALQGHGENVRLRAVREQTLLVRAAWQDAKAALISDGMNESNAVKLLLAKARQSRDAVEGEWGAENAKHEWVRLSLPLVNASP